MNDYWIDFYNDNCDLINITIQANSKADAIRKGKEYAKENDLRFLLARQKTEELMNKIEKEHREYQESLSKIIAKRKPEYL
jgi:hypothetical protein